jgi:hypothetical protein
MDGDNLETAGCPYGAFSVRFTDERRTFHAREPIEIELVYERAARFTVRPDDGPEALSLTRARFDRAVAAHLRIVDSNFDDHIPGGVLGCQTYAPIVVRRTLTHLYRFDTPGRYRMFLQSRQVTPEFETSNILEFDILPRDAVWEEDVLKRAEGALTESPADKSAAANAFQTLRTLATNEATIILARYYGAGLEHLETPDVEYGLFARSRVVSVWLRLRASSTRAAPRSAANAHPRATRFLECVKRGEARAPCGAVGSHIGSCGREELEADP